MEDLKPRHVKIIGKKARRKAKTLALKLYQLGYRTRTNIEDDGYWHVRTIHKAVAKAKKTVKTTKWQLQEIGKYRIIVTPKKYFAKAMEKLETQIGPAKDSRRRARPSRWLGDNKRRKKIHARANRGVHGSGKGGKAKTLDKFIAILTKRQKAAKVRVIKFSPFRTGIKTVLDSIRELEKEHGIATLTQLKEKLIAYDPAEIIALVGYLKTRAELYEPIHGSYKII